jgi:hypothetical protein
VQVCVLGSREQMCIHPEVAAVDSAGARNQLCRKRVAQRACEFRNRMDGPSQGFLRSEREREKESQRTHIHTQQPRTHTHV